MSEEETVRFVRRLEPYTLFSSGHNEDPFVLEVLQDCALPETLNQLKEYTRGMYSQELHYESFGFFRRKCVMDYELFDYVRHHPSFLPALEETRNQLSCVRGVRLIRPDQMNLIDWIPSSAAGYGYIGPKSDNYLLAWKNATRALYGSSKWGKKYRFVPDKAFARNQLALRATPKIRHVWGRAFHHILIEGLVGQPLLQALMASDNPIYIGRDIHKDMPYIIIKAMQDGGICYCLDFSKFDASVCAGLISVAWDLIYELLDLRDHVDHLVYQFIPIIMPDGRLFIVTSGVPSGSYFTQIVNSIVNMLMHTTTRQFFALKVLGDDSLFVTPCNSLITHQVLRK